MSEKITVRCTGCSSKLSVPALAAGKKIRCPKCKAILSIPDIGAVELPPRNGSSTTKKETDAWTAEDSDFDMQNLSWATDSMQRLPPLKQSAPAPEKAAAPNLPGVDAETFRARPKLVHVCVATIVLAISAAAYVVYSTETKRAIVMAEDLRVAAMQHLDRGEIEDANKLLQEYVASWGAIEAETARAMLEQIRLVTSDDAAIEYLVQLPETEFNTAVEKHAFSDDKVSHPALLDLGHATFERNLSSATQLRKEALTKKEEEERVELARLEHERQQKVEAAAKAEQQRQAKQDAMVHSSSAISRLLQLNQKEREQLRADIVKLESDLATAELSTRTVFQQQIARIDTCISMTALLAKSLGATQSEVDKVTSGLRTADIRADNVFQQSAGHLSTYVDMLKLAAVKAGASTKDCETVQSEMRLNDIGADTAPQQIAIRLSAAAAMTGLLSHQFGASEKTIAGITSDMTINNIRADTVFQQMSARQTGIVRLLGAAALAEGADNIAVSRIESSMSTDDLAVDTVQQQFSARIKRSIEMTALLARAVVEK